MRGCRFMPRRRLGPVVLVFVSCVLLVSARDLPPRHVAQALPRVGLLWHGPAMQGPMLALRGGQSNEADGETAAPSAAAAAGAGVVRKWEDRDGDSRSGDEEDDEEKWDYGKFGMTEPVVEDGQSLNAEMTGCEGEPGYIGADPFIGKWGWTALHRAACEGDSGTLRKMLEMGGDANVVTHNGWTPLIEAASEGHTECVKVLLHFGANVSLPTRGGWSPLHFAVGNGHMETIQELLKNGADPLWQDCYGDYPMDKAMRSAELDYPTLPLRCNVSMPVADRKALYYAAAAAVNVTAQRAHEMNFSRFSLYAEPIAGKRYSYDLDFAAEGEEHQDGTADTFDGNEEYLKDDEDFVDMDQAKENYGHHNDSLVNDMLLQKLQLAHDVEAPRTSHTDGVLDEDIQELLSRWRDEEYEKRLAQGIPSAQNDTAETGEIGQVQEAADAAETYG